MPAATRVFQDGFALGFDGASAPILTQAAEVVEN